MYSTVLIAAFCLGVDGSEAETGADDVHNQLVEDDDEEVTLLLA